MLSLLAPILVFGLVVFVHELGHFLAAKAVGVYAPRFSIGFGPALFRRRRGETEYVIAAFPLGGYVRMASRHDEETAFLEGGSEEANKKAANDPDYDPEAMIPFGPKPVPPDRWFESKSLPARILIMIAGVAMNVLLSIVVLAALAYQMGRSVVTTTVVGDVRPVASAPALAEGLHAGDTLRAVDGKAVTTWNGVVDAVADAKGHELVLTTNRGDVRVPLGDGKKGATTDEVLESVIYRLPPVLDSVLPGRPAARAGLRPGDKIVAVDGAPVADWTGLVARVSASAGRPIALDYERGGVASRVTVTPEGVKEPDETGKTRTVGKVGALPRDISTRERVTLGEAVAGGWTGTWRMAGMVKGFLGKIFTGQLSVSQLGGPVAITQASVTAARNGLAELFKLVAFLSINVAVLNMLPIPILDGGQILLNVAEAAKGSPFSVRTREYILRFGLLAIALLFVTVMFNDITRLVGRFFG